MYRSLVLGVCAGLALMLAACGGDDDKGDAAQTTPAATSSAATATSAPAGTATVASTATATPAATTTAAQPMAVQIKAGERGQEYFFEPKDILVRAGQRVSVTVSNGGPERRHTWKVKNKSGNGDLAATNQVNVNDSAVIEFTVSEPGTYEIYCSNPGHADRGQRGTLTVTS